MSKPTPVIQYPFGLPASQTVTVNKVPVAGTTLTIDGTAYTMGTDFRGETRESVALAIEQLIRADLGNVDIGSSNPAKTTTAVSYGNVVRVLASVPGTAGNSITLATSDSTAFTLGGATLANGTAAPTTATSTTLPTGASASQVQGTAADNAVAVGSPVQAGGVAVEAATYAPAYTTGDAAKLPIDKDSGGLLTHTRKLTRTDDAVASDPKQYSNAPSNATIATTDATVFTLAAGEKGFIQNLHTTALAVRRAASATTTAFHTILRGGTGTDDGIGATITISDHIGAVSVAALTGSPRYIAWKV